MLARRDHSRDELTLKLRAKNHPPEAIEAVINDLASAGLINEQRFIENYIYWRRKKGYGPLRISMELQTKGLPCEMIAQAIQIADNAWLDEARRVWQKHFRGQTPVDFKTKAKQMRFLQYRGFTLEHIEQVFEK